MSTDTSNFGPPIVEAVDVHHHYGEGPQRADVLEHGRHPEAHRGQ